MSSIFPAAYSTLDAAALADLVYAKYDLGGVRCTFLLRGVNDTYLVESDKGRYILRVYRNSHRSRVEIEAEVSLLLSLHSAEVPVSYPLSDQWGEFLQPLEAAEGVRYAVLFTYAPGQSVSKLNEGQLQELGRQMARFHVVSAGLGLEGVSRNFDLETTLFEPLKVLKPYFLEDPEGYAWMERAAEQVVKKLAGLDVAAFSTGYCQYDFLPKNFHFEGDSVTFFDFDFMGRGWLVNDIMSFWQQLTIDVHFGRMTDEELTVAYGHFLDGYRAVKAVSPDELEAVPYLVLGFWLFYTHFHTTHDNFYPFIQPGHLKLRVALMQRLMKKWWPEPFPAPEW